MIESFLSRIREKFLEIDLDGLLDVDQAAPAHAGGGAGHLAGGEDALVHRLEPEVEIDGRALRHGDETLAQLVADRDAQVLLLHRAGSADEVVHIDRVRSLLERGHDRLFYEALPGLTAG